MNSLNPTQRFLASKFAAEHQNWCKSETSQAAIEAALTELSLSLTPNELPAMVVVRKFADVLLNLTEIPKPKTPIRSATLQYDQPKPKPE